MVCESHDDHRSLLLSFEPSDLAQVAFQGELVTQVQTKAREDLQSCVANALLNARTLSSSVPSTAAGSRIATARSSAGRAKRDRLPRPPGRNR